MALYTHDENCECDHCILIEAGFQAAWKRELSPMSTYELALVLADSAPTEGDYEFEEWVAAVDADLDYQARHH